MKKTLWLVALTILMMVCPLKAQECTYFYPMEKGTVIELKHYDKKAKTTGTTRQEVIDKQAGGGAVSITIRSTFFDQKDEELMTADLTMECRNGIFTFSMDNYLNDEMLAAIGDYEFTIEGDNLEFPANMKAGDVLKDGKISITVEGMAMLNMVTTVHNRKVEAVEKITTEAGTFECFKVSYDVLTDAMIDMRTKGIEWIAQDVGAVRTETFNKNGKLTGYSELIKIEK